MLGLSMPHIVFRLGALRATDFVSLPSFGEKNGGITVESPTWQSSLDVEPAAARAVQRLECIAVVPTHGGDEFESKKPGAKRVPANRHHNFT